MMAPQLPMILKTRLVVGYLGERAQSAWWPTAFYEPSGRLFLEPVFSKTRQLAQYHGVLEAARRLHDEHLSVNAFHLFRLPEEIEQDLHKLIQRPEAESFVNQRMLSRETAIEALKFIADGISTGGTGPIAIGSIRDLDSAVIPKTIAAAYLKAFEQNAKVFPYLKG